MRHCQINCTEMMLLGGWMQGIHCAISSSDCPDSSETFDWIHPRRFQAQSASIFFHGWCVCPWISRLDIRLQKDDPNSFCIFPLYILHWVFQLRKKRVRLYITWGKIQALEEVESWLFLAQIDPNEFLFHHPINRSATSSQHYPNKCLSYDVCFLFKNI